MAEKQDNINKNRELLAKQGDFKHVKEIDNSDKNTFHLPRREVASKRQKNGIYQNVGYRCYVEKIELKV